MGSGTPMRRGSILPRSLRRYDPDQVPRDSLNPGAGYPWRLAVEDRLAGRMGPPGTHPPTRPSGDAEPQRPERMVIWMTPPACPVPHRVVASAARMKRISMMERASIP